MALHVLILLLVGCSLWAEDAAMRGQALGTGWSVTCRVGEIGDFKALRRAIEIRLEEIEESMSTWRDDSEISHFNASGSTNWFPVSAEFALVLERGLKVAAASGGALDPTVYPLFELWGFTSGGRAKAPDGRAFSIALSRVGLRGVNVRLNPAALRKSAAEIRIDVSAFAKGHAVDSVAEILTLRGATNWLVDIGGEVRAFGQSSKKRPWRVGIEQPVPGLSRIHSVVEVSEGAVATSGDYRNYIELAGVRHAHIIDPGTGKPIRQRGLAVSVRGDDCLTADAWATAMCVLGPMRGVPLARVLGLNVMFIERDREGFRVETVGEWPVVRHFQ